MTLKFKFIARQLFVVMLPMFVVLIIFVLIDTLIFKESIIQSITGNSIFIMLALPIIETLSLLSLSKRAKRLNIQLWKKENDRGSLTHTINVNQPQEEIIDKLQQGNWKYKIQDKKVEGTKTILLLKHYQIPTNGSAVFLELENESREQTKVSFKTYNGAKYRWWSLLFTEWSIQLKQIEYFENIILDRKEQNAQLSMID